MNLNQILFTLMMSKHKENLYKSLLIIMKILKNQNKTQKYKYSKANNNQNVTKIIKMTNKFKYDNLLDIQLWKFLFFR